MWVSLPSPLPRPARIMVQKRSERVGVEAARRKMLVESLRKGPVPCPLRRWEKIPQFESREVLGPISHVEPRGEDPKEKKCLSLVQLDG